MNQMQMLAQALGKRVKEVDNTRVPYLAGMNRQGTKLYFSKDFPHQLQLPTGQTIDPKPFVTVHEEVETALMKQGHSYASAHQIATHYEHQAVASAGINPSAYESALKPYINEAHGDKAGEAPKGLNRKPYEQSGERSLVDG